MATARSRPVLVGMNNPLSDNPHYALAPFPAGCTGWRVWRMLVDVRPASLRQEYMARFDRRNVLNARQWSDAQAREAGAALRAKLGALPTTVVVFGARTWAAMGLPPEAPYVLPVQVPGLRPAWRRLPHPSGRTRYYNDPANRLVLGLLLEELIENG